MTAWSLRSPSTGPVLYSAQLAERRVGAYPRPTLPVAGLRMSQDFVHEPVLIEAVVTLFAPVPAGTVIDGTVGGGGHGAALLQTHDHLHLLGIDRDPIAVAIATQRLAAFGARATVIQGRFADLGALAAGADGPVVGVLLDLGVSSPQLDLADRGFSYRLDAPLDMRMNPSDPTSAADLINTIDQRQLVTLLRDNGEGSLAPRLARAIIAARPITTTAHLAAVVESATPAKLRRRGHPAKRVFQGLRIAVNDELGELARVLPIALELVVPGGRVAVISYHSGEDRMVKQAFANAVSGGCTCPPGLPCVCGAQSLFSAVGRRVMANEQEISANPRARSARLRAVERLAA